jgi:glucokinase
LNGEELSQILGIKRFLLINDFAAIGYGLLALRDEDRILLNKDAKSLAGAPVRKPGWALDPWCLSAGVCQ